MHSFLFRLPCGFICDLLTNWCSYKDVGRLDSSCTSLALRSRYLECVSSSMVAFRSWHVNISNFPEYVQWLNIRAVSITSLAVPALYLKQDRDYLISAKNVARLKHLCLENCVDLTDNMFQAIAKGCAHLSTVSIGSDHHPSWITDASLLHLSRTTSALKKFRLVQNCLVSNAGIASICASNTGLSEVEIQKCCNVGERAISALAKYCSSLAVVRFGDNQPLSAACVAMLSHNCSKLYEIALKSFRAVLPVMSPVAPSPLPRLQTFSLSSVPDGLHLHLPSILANAASLRTLVLHDVKSLVDADFVRTGTLEHLTCLSVASCPRLTASGLQALLQRCPALREVRLHACPANLAVLEGLVHHCPEVSVLSLTWCSGVDDAALAVLLAQDAVPPLRQLTLNGSARVTNVSLKALVHFLPTLTTLSVSYCAKITQEAVNEVRTRHPTLQILC